MLDWLFYKKDGDWQEVVTTKKIPVEELPPHIREKILSGELTDVTEEIKIFLDDNNKSEQPTTTKRKVSEDYVMNQLKRAGKTNAINFCPYCGAKVRNIGAKFCTSCGKSLSDD